ncbi:hypothetical protein KIW84_035170 [Lathyrus oleraceus]|uniref:Retrovirus-related Pol polyprotein from transposon TNT 1-94-like beta-barrel domain-containing protein n=1 Tax=Pisum sativum TaxID=3888 RepID=A0A9D4Y315_PEA|nr:hypothetical protein KIW84_035170 [Pisum sativum]
MAQSEINSNDNVWYLDSGASNHMCGHKHLFKEMRKIEDGNVSFGDASKVIVEGKGTIRYLQKDGLIGSIQDVYYVPNLKTNILSLGRLTEKGYSILMKERILYLKDKLGHLIARVEMERNRMYKLNLINVREKCLQVFQMISSFLNLEHHQMKIVQNQAEVVYHTFPFLRRITLAMMSLSSAVAKKMPGIQSEAAFFEKNALENRMSTQSALSNTIESLDQETAEPTSQKGANLRCYTNVKRFQERKHIYGITGDGVNDAPSLKKADIGIVVAEATNVVRGASDIVLAEPGLSVIISVVLTSMAIFQRMKKLHDLRGIYHYPYSVWLHVHCTDMEI